MNLKDLKELSGCDRGSFKKLFHVHRTFLIHTQPINLRICRQFPDEGGKSLTIPMASAKCMGQNCNSTHRGIPVRFQPILTVHLGGHGDGWRFNPSWKIQYFESRFILF